LNPLDPQPAPLPAEGDVWAEIIAELPEGHVLRPLAIERRAQGIERYGVPLQRGNGRDHLVDALQEALDLMVYLRAATPRPGIWWRLARALVERGGPHASAAAELTALLSARHAARAEAQTALSTIALQRHALWRLPLAPVDPTARDVARWLLAEGAA